MLYLLFFLLRDGAGAVAHDPARRFRSPRTASATSLEKFATVIRATVKGNIVVAIVQGALGGLAFWYLGRPRRGAVGRGDGVPVAAAGGRRGADLAAGRALPARHRRDRGRASALIAFGVLVIGLIDNVLRPILVGKDTQMPDYLVLLSTLGGMAIFGLNGFVIGPVIAAMFLAAWEIFVEARVLKKD